MKKLLITAAVLTMGATALAAAIEQVIVRQQWPWSTDVKVEYKLSGVTTPVDIRVKAFNGETELAIPVTAIKGDLYGVDTDGIGQFIIDPVVAFGTEKVALANFKVQLTVEESSSDINEELYRIYNLVNGNVTSVTRKRLLNGEFGTYETDFTKFGNNFQTTLTNVLVWTAVTNDISYMTTNLVMRKIPAGGEIWQAGSPADEPGRTQFEGDPDLHYVKLTEDYFIGVFPMTQEQHRLITGSNPSSFADQPDSPARPVEKVSYAGLRGSHGVAAKNYGESGEIINWPTNSYLHDVYTVGVLGKLRKKFTATIHFDLPTGYQWEFACRAGTAGALNSGKSLTAANMGELGWYTSNSDSSTHRVGLKKPNAFGLYDMHGNVQEQVLEWAGTDGIDQTDKGASKDNPKVDPLGATSHSQNVRYKRGGCYSYIMERARSASRSNNFNYSQDVNSVGYRVVCPAAASGRWNQ